jgi:HD-GYP domain-containing protein (c-di-GMP phosphodiesterase class II)
MKNGELARVAETFQRFTVSKYPDIGEHQEDVAALCDRYAEFIGMDAQEREAFRISGLLHDFGKNQFSKEVLHSPGRLNHVEMSMMQQHPELGAYFMEPLCADPRIMAVVRQHHEDYDGGGYPLGLGGEEISPWACRVRGLDSLAALTANRPYHQAIDRRAALLLMQTQAQRYDPEVLRIMFAMFNESWEPL